MGFGHGDLEAVCFEVVHRYLELEPDGLFRPVLAAQSSPNRPPAKVEERICRIRRREKFGPGGRGGRLWIPASTVHRVLVGATTCTSAPFWRDNAFA
jgi:hypothetical protein